MFNSILDELKEVKYFEKIIILNRFQQPKNVKYLKEMKRAKSLQKAVVYLEPKQASTMEFFCEYT